MRMFLIILSTVNFVSARSLSRKHASHHSTHHSHYPTMSSFKHHHSVFHRPNSRSLGEVGLTGARRVSPVYLPGYSSPLVADAGSNAGESGITLAPRVINGSQERNVGIYVSPSRNGRSISNRNRLINLHHLIHHAQGEALKAKAISSAARFEASALLAQKQELNAKIMDNKAKMLQEEEERLVAQRSADPLILVKDTVPIANVANNNLSFEHHNELLSQKLNMIKKDQDDAVKKAENIARLHKARTNVLPDSLVASNPNQFKDFVNSGPTQDLTFEIPVDPSTGNYYISTNPGEDLQGSETKLTTGDLPYFVAHGSSLGSDNSGSFLDADGLKAHS
ncbi:hypothetical protein EHEL_050160 [Encephalitozoon hellem ATCC 50504]|nr:uncharacterized protein EHEL_050160 [Encephalitozoon hellem ATCC 50504]AFM98227.1 hypothetical protein EHEL_050160 [Encephalitozoon hellem ATCC 50504]|eukprot:XP_003887208.1 hypothetical protein EHEL_050160 [Encephalitozoon hellem ATCC 50504]